MYIDNDSELSEKLNAITNKYNELLFFQLILLSLFIGCTYLCISVSILFIFLDLLILVIFLPIRSQYRFIRTLMKAKAALELADSYFEEEHKKKKVEFFKK